MTIRTITVSGVTAVYFDPNSTNPYFYASEKYCWVKNNSSAAMYVSLNESCTAGADGTALIAAGETGLIQLSPANTIYISGSGSAEIRTTDVAVCPFKISAKGGDLITKTITENGTYSASDDSADGYSSVTVNVSGGGSLPSAYSRIDYVNCGSGTNKQSGFTLQNYSLRADDVVEIVTTTPSFVDSEAAIFGNSNGGYEIYYNPSFEVSDYGGYFTISNTAEQIAGGLIKNTTLATIRSSVSYKPNVGYYRSERYPYVGRMYSCRVLRPIADASGTATGQQKVLIDLVPCVRIADSTVGMFDLVYQVFYASDTGDPFTAPET